MSINSVKLHLLRGLQIHSAADLLYITLLYLMMEGRPIGMGFSGQ